MSRNEQDNAGRRNTVILIAVIAVLSALTVVLALLNADGAAKKREMQNNATFLIITGDKTVTVTMEDIISLDPAEVEAVHKNNGKAAEPRVYTGVPLAGIFAVKAVDTNGYEAVSFTAADGYASAVSMAEALDTQNCHIVIAEAGEPLGRREDGGSGPYMMIMAKDAFSQRWCKYLTEVKLQ